LRKNENAAKDFFGRDVESNSRTVDAGHLSALHVNPIQEGHPMLVLTRRPGESIVIGNGIKITVVNIGPGRVKIGVEAPASVRVDRAEIHARILNEQASDVLNAVAGNVEIGVSDHPTIVNSGADTDVLTNRVAAQLPDAPPAPVVATPPANGSDSGHRLSKFRAPRKPR